MAVAQGNAVDCMIEKFRSAVLMKSERSRLNYVKAVNCLETFLGTYTYSSDFPSEQTLGDWLLNMRVRGISGKTAIHYLDIISALYKETASDSNSEVPKIFRQFKTRTKQISGPTKSFDNKSFDKILTVTKSVSTDSIFSQCAADMLLYSLLNTAMPLAEVAKVKVSEVAADSDAVSVIVRRNADSNRKYLFPLEQSKLTPKQLSENIELKIRGLFIANNIPIVRSADNTIRLIWAYAALKCGIPGSEIVALLGSAIATEGLPEMSLCVKADVSCERRAALTETVNTLLSNNPLRWYAMKLRSRVSFEDVVERTKNLDDRMLRPEFFYPLDEICKRVGKKIIKDEQPVIRDIVFFKLRVTDIFPLVCKIGDLAWCYTTTGKPGGDYAPIPLSSFNRFQETIGHFTPEYDIAPIGTFEPKEGESVVIINGPLANYEFEVEKATDADNVIFQLNMIGDNGFQWRTSAKKRQIGPLSAK